LNSNNSRQQQQQQADQQQQDEALPPPAADHESDPMDHVEGETAEHLAVMLVGFVEARTIVTEMNEYGYDVGTPIPIRDKITHTILTTTEQNKHVVITYYANGLEDEDSYVEGTTVKVGGSECDFFQVKLTNYFVIQKRSRHKAMSRMKMAI
jgi:hypothetical protein